MNDLSWYFNIMIVFGGAIITFLTFVDEIATKLPPVAIIKILGFKLLVFCVGTAFIVAGSILKDNESNNSARNEKAYYVKQIFDKDSIYKKERSVADSVYQVKLQSIVDSSYAKSIKASNDALAKYNLVLIDSMKRVAGGKSALAQLVVAPASIGDTPPIYVSSDSNNNKTLHIKFVSSLATSYKINFRLYIVSEIGYNFILHQINVINQDVFIVPDVFKTFRFPLLPNLNTHEQDDVFLVLIGTFSRDPSGNVILPYRQSFHFNIRDNKYINSTKDLDYKGFDEFRKRNNI